MGAALQGNSGPLDALRTTRRDLPLLGAGDTPQAGRPAGGAPTPQRCTTRCASTVRGQAATRRARKETP